MLSDNSSDGRFIQHLAAGDNQNSNAKRFNGVNYPVAPPVKTAQHPVNSVDSSGCMSSDNSSRDQSCRSLFGTGQHENLIQKSHRPVADHNNNHINSPCNFINANGSIFTLAPIIDLADQMKSGSSQELPCSDYRKQQHPSELESRYQKPVSPTQTQLSSPYRHRPPLPLPTNSHIEEQHRRIHYQPIHQKLQQIYCHKLQEFEQKKQLDHRRQQHHQSSSLAADPLGQEPAEQERRPFVPSKHSMYRDSDKEPPAASGTQNQHKTTQQIHVSNRSGRHQAHQNHFLNPCEQTYDLIRPEGNLAVGAHDEECDWSRNHQSNPSFSRHQRTQQTHQHHLGHQYQFQNNNLIGIREELEEGSDLIIDSIQDLRDDCEQEEDELLIPMETKSTSIKAASANKHPSSSQSALLVDSRKKHLESLHYATATAAALLNVTASAAAAFAATERHLNKEVLDCETSQRQHSQRNTQRHGTSDHSTARGVQLTTYQDIENIHPQQQQGYCEPVAQYRPSVQSTARERNSRALPYGIYGPPGIATNQTQDRRSNRGPSSVGQQPVQSMQTRQQQRHQRELYQPRGPRPPPVPPTQKIPLNPLAHSTRAHGHQQREQLPRLSLQQIDLLRQHGQVLKQQQRQQQQLLTSLRPISLTQNTNVVADRQNQLIQPSLALPSSVGLAPSLAILHHKAKAGVNTELMARFAGQHLQQQQVTQRPRLQIVAGVQDPRLMVAQNLIQMVTARDQRYPNGTNQTRTRNTLAQQVNYGVTMLSEQNDAKINHQIYSLGGQLPLQLPSKGLPASGASSDASGHTNLPLIIDRDLKKSSIIERICRIDLTLFWWSLLTICVILMASVVAVSRYVL